MELKIHGNLNVRKNGNIQISLIDQIRNSVKPNYIIDLENHLKYEIKC